MTPRRLSRLYCARQTAPVRRARRSAAPAGVLGLLRSIQTIRAAFGAAISAISPRLKNHRAVTRVTLATLALAAIAGLSLQGATAGPPEIPTRPTTLLPENVGIGVPTTDAVNLTFDEAMEPDSVESAMTVRPTTAVRLRWSADRRTVLVAPERRWRTDARYVVAVASSARSADGGSLGEMRQLSFTTQTAPTVSDFQVRYVGQSDEQRMRALLQTDPAPRTADDLVPPADTTQGVSAGTTISVGFSVAMDRRDTERRFVISPHVPGDLSWEGNGLVFTPSQRLEPSARYAVSVVGARDAQGNRVAGDVAFSFTTQVAAQVVKVSPASAAKDVTANQAVVWFSRPMDTASTGLHAKDLTNGGTITGTHAWNEAGTQLTFTFAQAPAAGHTVKMSLGSAARDEDRNPVTASWSFAMKSAPPPAPAPARVTSAAPRAAPPPPADLQQYALWQINQSRAQYGFAPLRLDAAITAVASAHAWDMMNYGYFSHTGRDGSRVAQRMARAGISFSYSGENICYYNGIGARATLDWCHRTFMSEPYPGYYNHIANILNPNFTRLGVGIAQSGGRIKIVWDFAG